MQCPSCPPDAEAMVDVPAPFGKGTYLYCRTCKRELDEIQKVTAKKDYSLKLPEGFSFRGLDAGSYKLPQMPIVSYYTGDHAPCTMTGTMEIHKFSNKLPARYDQCFCGAYMWKNLQAAAQYTP